MTKKNGSNFQLILNPKETATVKVVKSIKLLDKVSYSLNGGDTPGELPKSQPCSISIDSTSDLGVSIFYAENEGGSFTIDVTGSDGGDTSSTSDIQQKDEAFRSLSYTFFLAE